MSQKHLTSCKDLAERKSSTWRKDKESWRDSRIKSAIFYGKATPIQSYRGVHLVRFEHEHGKDGPLVVIAEEWPFRSHKSLTNPALPNVSKQAGKHFKVICSYKTSKECINADAGKHFLK